MTAQNNIDRMIMYLLDYKCIENRLERSAPVIETLCLWLSLKNGCFFSCLHSESVVVLQSRNPAARIPGQES